MLEKLYGRVTPYTLADKRQIRMNHIYSAIAGITYPVYCALAPLPDREPLEKPQIIVSVTSFPARIRRVHLALQSLLRQRNVPAYQLILWLAESQFPGRRIPRSLETLRKKGLLIQWTEDLGPYKKIIPAEKAYPQAIVVTADDDFLYPEDWLSGLLKTHERYPHAIACYRAHQIRWNEQGYPLPYRKWNSLSAGISGPAMDLLVNGGAGAVYPPGFLQPQDYQGHPMMKLAPYSDDLWLKAMEWMKQIPAVKVYPHSKELFTLRGTQKEKLMRRNNGPENENDAAIRRLTAAYPVLTLNETCAKILS